MIKLKNLIFEIDGFDNIGYHAGDGGISRDTTFKRMGASRSTGHFGTGVYFCGSPDKITGRQDRPILKIDLSGLKLAKPSSPLTLHEALKNFNKLIYNELKLEWGEPRFLSERILSALRLELWISKDNIKHAMIKIYSLFLNKEHDEFKSPSTYLMQELGYDGIDVRFTNADNTMYGSVIYPNAKIKIL